MTNLDEYYRRQAGTGIAVYPGIRYQRGHGFFGRFFHGNLLPALQTLGHQVLSTGVNVANDIVNNNANPLESLKTHGKSAAKKLANDIISATKTKFSKSNTDQGGSGYKRSIKASKKRKSTSVKKTTTKKTSMLKKKKPTKKKKQSSSSRIKKTTIRKKKKTATSSRKKPKSSTRVLPTNIPKCFAL